MAPRTARRWPGRLLWGALALLLVVAALAPRPCQPVRLALKPHPHAPVQPHVAPPPAAAPAG